MENKQVQHRIKKGLWTPEEDLILKTHVETHGEGNWATLSKKSGLKRGGKSCRLRWMNYLRPNIKRGGMSQDEEDLIIRMHKLLGNRWSLIAGRLPGRTDNEVKNYWNTHLNKNLCSKKRNSIDTDKGNDKNRKRNRKIRKLQDICQTSLESTVQESDTKKEETEESNGTETWIQNAQRMNYCIESPLEMPLNNDTFVFDNDPMLAYLDSFVSFESFGWYAEDTCLQLSELP